MQWLSISDRYEAAKKMPLYYFFDNQTCKCLDCFEKVCFHYNSVRYYYSVLGTRSY
jgi:hypothetical protein